MGLVRFSSLDPLNVSDTHPSLEVLQQEMRTLANVFLGRGRAFIYPRDYQYKPNFSIKKTDCELELSPGLN